MAKYLVLYKSTVSPEEMMGAMTPEQSQAGMDMWMAWAGKCGDALVDLGSPVGGGQAVTSSGTTGATSQVCGFSVLQADSADAATGMLENHPHLMSPGEPSIEVLEYLAIPGM